MFQRLLVCTDFTDGLHRLVHFIPDLAKMGIQGITFLHVVPLRTGGTIPHVDTEKVEQARKALNIALDHAIPGLEVHVEVESGRATDSILAITKSHRIDLILLGMANRSSLAEKWFGSTTLEVCQRTTVPLLILRPELIATYTSEELALRCQHLLQGLLLPYDGEAGCNYVIEKLKQLDAGALNHAVARIHLCWVVGGLRRRDVPVNYQVTAAQETLAKVGAALETQNLQVSSTVVEGDPITEILEMARFSDVSAIIASSGSPNKLLDWSVPHFTDELLRRSWHPILYFPPAR